MATYLMLSNLTERGRDRVRHNPERIEEVNREIADQGCTVIAQYALLGEYDFATIIEAPGNEHMHKLAIELGARGTIETHTMPALPTEDFVRYMSDGAE